MLGPTYLAFKRLFYCVCLARPSDFLSRFRNLAGPTQRIKIDKIESHTAPAEEAGMILFFEPYVLTFSNFTTVRTQAGLTYHVRILIPGYKLRSR